MKLPRKLLLEGQNKEIENFIEAHRVLLNENGGELYVPSIAFSTEVKNSLQLARRSGQLQGGLENIEEIIEREEAGLKLNQKRENKNSNERISRILFMSQDGSERFYKHCEAFLTKYKKRILGCRLEASAEEIGKAFFGENAQVKAMILMNKNFVAHTLLAMMSYMGKKPA